MSRLRAAAALAAAALGVLASCRPRSAAAPDAPARTRAGGAAEEAKRFGALSGRAPAKTVVFLADPLDADGSLKGGLTGGLTGSLSGGLPAGRLPPASGIELRLRGGKIEPAISAAPLHSELVLVSGDGTFSDISAYYGLTDSAFRRKFVLPGDRFSFTLARPGMMAFEDENRPTERAYLYVTPTPAFAVAGEAGRYLIAKMPAGKHLVTAWNLNWGILDAETTVEKGKTSTLDFEFPAK